MNVKPTVTLISWTGSLYPAYKATRDCKLTIPFKNIPNKDKEQYYADFLKTKCIDMGHWATLEFIDFQLELSNVSRVLTHQLVRHRIASYMQQSQRAVHMSDFNYTIPKIIDADVNTRALFKETMANLAVAYEQLTTVYGIPIEDARYVLPNACATNITVKMNARALIEATRLRTCAHAQREIRDVFRLMRIEVNKVCPLVASYMYPTCKFGYCNEDWCTTVSTHKAYIK